MTTTHPDPAGRPTEDRPAGSMPTMDEPATVTLRYVVPVEVVLTVPDADQDVADADDRVRAVLATLRSDDPDIRVVPDIDLPEPVEERP